MKQIILFMMLVLLTGCPRRGYEGEELGVNRAIYIDGNRVCFTIDKNEVLSRYGLSINGKKYKRILVNDFVHLTYPDTCFKVNLEKGVRYAVSYTLNDKNYKYAFIIDNEDTVIDLRRY
ncbi:hypothetical protein C6560_03725 [Enterobacter sp. FS01]|uniref:putative T6SS immunity periplasmic lipoprotein n=1 Tax=unclassified Leclercia TaxID=2627398 RepID=UPI000D13244B|nr:MULTISPECIES: putative T6SS immunity periplasmic lipoprotein [unclassified Leclercia]MCT9843161.1 hypothetical protein [Leclercia adecarboxylata ATCC 23216 = NBRC 102595]PSS53522.1 hypothetical protein C6560_03725 [Enterobacter sp. FS01]